MTEIYEKPVEKKPRPIKVLQFGEGNFLRAFVDYMIDYANERTDFNGDIIIVKPIIQGDLKRFHDQKNLYTVSLRGLKEGKELVENRIITSISDAIDCTTEYQRYSELAKVPTLRFIVSNTTEAGIIFDQADRFELMPPKTYPGKLTKFLYERYSFFHGEPSRGVIILPVELIDDNGIQLKECVRKLSKLWKLPDSFLSWIDSACIFCSTLVDRIVTGFPKERIEEEWKELGYRDRLLDVAEPFGLWVIESDRDISQELLLKQSGMPVIFTNDQKPYRQRKVSVLNGAHTSFALASFLCGNNYVRESMQDKTVLNFIKQTIFNEIIPTLSLKEEELILFANAVLDRFNNPYIQHALLSISLNSVSKWRTRCLPSLTNYVSIYHKLPLHLTFSMAALIEFYKKGYKLEDGVLFAKRGEQDYKIIDDIDVLKFFLIHKDLSNEQIVKDFLSNLEFFGQDLTKIEGFLKETLNYVNAIEVDGIRTVMEGFEI